RVIWRSDRVPEDSRSFQTLRFSRVDLASFHQRVIPNRREESAPPDSYQTVLRLHHVQQGASALCGHYQQAVQSRFSAQEQAAPRFYVSLQLRYARLLRAVFSGRQRNYAREGNQGVASREETQADSCRECRLGRPESGIGRRPVLE